MPAQAVVGPVKAARKLMEQMEKVQPWQRWQLTRMWIEKLLPERTEQEQQQV